MLSDAPRIFLSYTSEDAYWVAEFEQSLGFAIGSVGVLHYAAEEVDYGYLRERLDEQIHRSAVVIAFVSSNYCKKKWTVAEWDETLTFSQRRRLVFVPLMLDADAIDWWKRQREEGKLSALPSYYGYVSFFDEAGFQLDPNDP
jgi:TIR domain